MLQADPVTGNFPGWEYISLVLALLLTGASALCLAGFFRRVRSGRLYSYRTVALLGLAIFLVIPALYRFRYFIVYAREGTFYQMLAGIVFSAQSFMVTSSPVLAAFALLLIASNVFLIAREGFAPANLYAMAFGLLMIAASAFGCFLVLFDNIRFGSNVPQTVYAACFCYLECLLVSVVICALWAGRKKPALDKDVLLILGCRIRPDGTLYPIIKGRVDKAMEFAKEQEAATGKAALFLPTGGKGTDEICSEAEAMRRYLVQQGIPESRIRPETESISTRENMRFSKTIADGLMPGARAAFATTGFHVFRSGMLARSIGWDMEGLGAKTKWYFWPNAFIREFIGLLAVSWKQHILILVLVSAFFTGITFVL